MRLAFYLSGRSLWIDETRLALNIGARSYAGLSQPLAYDQIAPLVFLWAERALVQALGVHDWALRLLPFAAGLGVLALAYPLARRAGLSAAPATLSTALVALSPNLIYYSSGLKPYAVDALATVLVVLLTLDLLETPDRARSRPRWLIAGLLAPWCSAPAVFALAAAGSAVSLERWRAQRHVPRWLALGGAGWAISFGLAYLAAYSSAARNPYMREFWSEAFLTPGPGWVARTVLRLREAIWGMFFEGSTRPTGSPAESLVFTLVPAALLLLAVAGTLRTGKTRPAWAILLAGPLAFALAASLVGAYPTAARLMLFAAPPFAVLLAAGADRAVAWVKPSARPIAWAGAALVLLGGPLLGALRQAVQAPGREPMAAVVGRFRQLAAPDESVYLAPGSIPAWVFYTTRWSVPDTFRLARVARLAGSTGPAFENAAPGRSVEPVAGSALELRDGGRLELLGSSSGIQQRPGMPSRQPRPDPDWVAEEVERILRSREKAVWLVLSYLYGFEEDMLTALDASGAPRTYQLRYGDILLVRYELPGGHPAR